MKRSSATFIFALAVAAGGCGTLDRLSNWWSGVPSEQSRRMEGAVELRCDAKKTLIVRIDPETAWVIFPDREFRLDAVKGSPPTRYSNGRTTLTSKGEEVTLEEDTSVTFSNCRQAHSG
jgi:membrane-bound inhibitor of C-type lysozyme